ncbi:MAG: hypothetical protein IT560_01170, partial [Alphaproteobacteria bacterium]|nr:hypothetical protein [Alphaproteobacteria bacterium]
MKKFITAAAALLATATAAHGFADPVGSSKVNLVTLKMAYHVEKLQTDKSDNLILSPYNINTNLALVSAGAAGETKAEISTNLQESPDAPIASWMIKQLNEQILSANKGHVDLLTANGIWVNKNAAKLSSDYTRDAKTNFNAEISNEDFTNKATVDKINSWVSKNTKGMITKVIQQLNPADAIVLARSLYFKGKWVMPFDKSLTEEKTFTADGGAKFVTPMMHQEYDHVGDIRAMSTPLFDAISLNYGSDEAQTMRLVLVRPKKPETSAREWLTRGQSDSKIIPWLDNVQYEDARGMVELPHLDIKQHHDLVPALQDMGIKQAFTNNADFRHMVDAKSQPLFISSVSHDIVFKTDEEGSEAAAITTMTMAGSAMAPAPPKTINIKFDRSFVFALQDVQTGTVLFIGAVNKPNEKMTPQ